MIPYHPMNTMRRASKPILPYGLAPMSTMQRSSSAPSLSKTYIVNKYFSDVQKNFRLSRHHHRGVDMSSVQLTPGQEVIYGGSKINLVSKEPAAPSLWCSMSSVNQQSQLEDLVHMPGPTTEDALLKTLQARFYTQQYYTSVGPVLLFLNPNNQEPSPEALSQSSRSHDKLTRILDYAIQKLTDTGCPQSVILSGVTGSGKTFNSILLLRQLFERTNGRDSAMFRYINAALTVLQRLTNARTQQCANSSRMSYFLVCHMKEGIINKTKMHCFLVDHCRVAKCRNLDGNFQIFYEMLAGLTAQEKEKYHLVNHDVHNLAYLSGSQHTALDRRKLVESFTIWKTSLAVLGIPLGDIMKILSAVLLLGNITFEDTSSLQLKIVGESEFQSVCALLHVPLRSLYKGLTSKSCQSRGQVYTTSLDATSANRRLELLAQSLYSRTVAAIVKRANNAHRSLFSHMNRSPIESPNQDKLSGSLPGLLPGTLSNGSVHMRISPTASHNSLHMHTKQLASDTFLAVLDMYGFENLQDNSLEQLCINLSSETLQHFYNTFVFKTTEESYIEEGIQADMDIHYFENAPIVELLSSQKTGILSLLEAECVMKNCNADTFMQKIRIQHSKDKHFKECTSSSNSFSIKHFAGAITYKAESFISKNSQVIPDDIVWLFAKVNCSFGFVTHLFSQELKLIQDSAGYPQGHSYSLTAHYNLYQDATLERSRTCVSQDFHLHLDTVLKTLVQTQPHFIRCLKSNGEQKTDIFEREFVLQQVRSFQVLETVYLMISGFPHRMRYKAFNTRYRLLHPELLKCTAKHPAENYYTESKQILELLSSMENQSHINTQWALGKKNIFLSESVSQLLEKLREGKRAKSALCIQTAWRRHRYVVAWPLLKRQLQLLKKHTGRGRKKLAHVQPRSRTLSADSAPLKDSGNKRYLRNSYTDLRFDKAKPPDLPIRRSYTIQGNRRVAYPQIRIMKENYSEPGKFSLFEGQEVKVIGVSTRLGYLDAEYNNMVIAVPFQLTDLYTKKNLVIANV